MPARLAHDEELPNDLGTLAAAYAEAGDFAKAVESQERANRLLTDEQAKAIGVERLALFKARKPYHDGPGGSVRAVTAAVSTVPAFGLDDQTAPAKVRSSGRIVAVTAMKDAAKGEWQNWIVALDPQTSRWEKITPAGLNVRLSPDGATVAFGIGTGIWSCPLKAGAEPRRIGEVGDPEAMEIISSGPTWTPDGKNIIATGAGSVAGRHL